MTLTKLLAGTLALVLVAGMTSPAYAGAGPQCVSFSTGNWEEPGTWDCDASAIPDDV